MLHCYTHIIQGYFTYDSPIARDKRLKDVNNIAVMY